MSDLEPPDHIAPPSLLPDFLLIGAPQSGADHLKQVLQAVPGIWFPPLDNILAFHPSFQLMRFLTLKKLARRQLAFNPKHLNWILRFFLRPAPSINWYRKLYRTRPDQEIQLKGEFSDEYSTLPYDGVEKLRRAVPDARIVLMIRNPIDRSYAGLRDKFASHPKMPFAKMNKRQLVSVMNSDWALTHSGYQSAIDSWNVFFPRQQIFIGFYDELATDAPGFYRRLFAFLGLPEDTPVAEHSLQPDAGFPKDLYKYLNPFYRREIEGLARRFGAVPQSWELPPPNQSKMPSPKPPAAQSADAAPAKKRST